MTKTESLAGFEKFLRSQLREALKESNFDKFGQKLAHNDHEKLFEELEDYRDVAAIASVCLLLGALIRSNAMKACPEDEQKLRDLKITHGPSASVIHTKNDASIDGKVVARFTGRFRPPTDRQPRGYASDLYWDSLERCSIKGTSKGKTPASNPARGLILTIVTNGNIRERIASWKKAHVPAPCAHKSSRRRRCSAPKASPLLSRPQKNKHTAYVNNTCAPGVTVTTAAIAFPADLDDSNCRLSSAIDASGAKPPQFGEWCTAELLHELFVIKPEWQVAQFV